VTHQPPKPYPPAELLASNGYDQPDKLGRFGDYGGRFVPETLMPSCLELEAAWHEAKQDPLFWQEFHHLLAHFVGRPSPLYLAQTLTDYYGGAKIYLKREDLNHTGAHKINNCVGQVLLAKRMGRTRIIAETGQGSMGWLRRQFVRALGCRVWSIWARSMWRAKSPMSFG